MSKGRKISTGNPFYGMMNNSQFHELFGSQWPPDQHGGHSSASTMLHQSQLPQGVQLKREPHTDVQVMHNQMGMDITSASVADSTSPPPGSSEGMFGSSISGMFMDKKAANSIRGNIIRHHLYRSICLIHVTSAVDDRRGWSWSVYPDGPEVIFSIWM